MITSGETYLDDRYRLTNANSIEAIIKITERCNINCSYCYFFNGGDEDYKKHPPLLSLATASDIAQFLLKGGRDLGASTIALDFHGGEPLLMKKGKFVEICEMFKNVLGSEFNLQFRIQTNGMLVDEGWIKIFETYQFMVGVSIDGPEEYNDKYRVDHNGKGTYQRVAAGIALLRVAASKGRIPQFGALCVINPAFDGKKIYRHFIDELGFLGMNFLLPLETYDELKLQPGVAKKYGKFICDVFDEYVKDDNARIRISILQNALVCMAGGAKDAANRHNALGWAHQAFVISSNGDIGPDDTLRRTHAGFFASGANVTNITLVDYLNYPLYRNLRAAQGNLHESCESCCWRNACYGGDLINRYNVRKGFDNPSALCQGLQDFYSHVAAYLLRHGLELRTLEEFSEWRPALSSTIADSSVELEA